MEEKDEIVELKSHKAKRRFVIAVIWIVLLAIVTVIYKLIFNLLNYYSFIGTSTEEIIVGWILTALYYSLAFFLIRKIVAFYKKKSMEKYLRKEQEKGIDINIDEHKINPQPVVMQPRIMVEDVNINKPQNNPQPIINQPRIYTEPVNRKMPVKFCRKCGAELLEGCDFCRKCGTKVKY